MPRVQQMRHFQVVCRSAKVGAIQVSVDNSESPNDVFIRGFQIENYLKKDPDPWNVTLHMERRP